MGKLNYGLMIKVKSIAIAAVVKKMENTFENRTQKKR
jgi:hypothetical protein